MPLKVEGDPGYGSMVGQRISISESLGGSENHPLLVLEAEPDVKTLKPLNREQLEATAGGQGWRKFRSRLVLLFWLGWLSMLATALAVVALSPRPVVTPLHWWQRELFYRLQPALFLDVDNTEPSALSKVSDRLPHIRSLGVGVLVLEGLFSHVSPPNLTEIDQQLGTLPQVHQLITDSHKAGVRVILDLCSLDLVNTPEFSNETQMIYKSPDTVQDSLRYWLQRGVAGFAICNTDSAFSEKTLTEWRGMFEEFSTENNERIVMVRQVDDFSLALNTSRSSVNSSLVDLFSESLLPSSSHLLSATELAEAVESKLKTLQNVWTSWTVDRPVERELQKVFMVLLMTLPGTPVIRYGDEISADVNASGYSLSHEDTIKKNLLDSRRFTLLFHSLSHTRSREEALLFGTFTFLPFNASTHTNSTAPHPLAFVRSWGCVSVLVLFNLGPERQPLDTCTWTSSLPEEGVFMTSSGLDRLGSVSLQSIKLQPYEAIVIKLFEPENYY
ncbi:4F2 cell-surface antigen heavy chain [Hoplias malabaricus]|uniref:4F2 cell-surface antigen heavy chain n=1 Tax=Hoplias malabaricus TaxID=27720 RepID=UPI0034628A91